MVFKKEKINEYHLSEIYSWNASFISVSLLYEVDSK